MAAIAWGFGEGEEREREKEKEELEEEGWLVFGSSFPIHCEMGITPANWPAEIRISDNLS